jgi:hypothetical protein
MTRLPLAVAAFALAALSVFADDPKANAPTSSRPPAGVGKIVTAQPSPYRPAGTVAGRVVSVSTGDMGGSITVAIPQVEPDRISSTGRVYYRKVDKEVDFDMADAVKVRFGYRPKVPAPPDNLPGYKAEPSDLHAGQVVKLTLGKKAPPGANLNAVKPTVTMIMIERDTAPPKDDRRGETPKMK